MYDTVSCTLKYANHTVILHCSLAQTTIGNDLRIYSEKGVIYAKDAFSEKSIQSIIISTLEGEQITHFDHINLYGKEVENFSDSLIKNTNQLGTSLDEAVGAMVILDSIRKSLASNTPVVLSNAETAKDAHV